jgi:hypothetical protein
MSDIDRPVYSMPTLRRCAGCSRLTACPRRERGFVRGQPEPLDDLL